MSHQDPHAPHSSGGHSPAVHGPGDHGATEHAHPGAGEYLKIAAILTVLTAIEVAIFYIPGMAAFLVPALIVLSVLKFVLVVMFYMHLKFDHPAFTWLFVLGLGIAAGIMISLMALFSAFGRFHQPHA
jgi:cytochrome c oxidase subunit 4